MCSFHLFVSSYKDTSVEVAETARALANAYSNVATEDAESEYTYLIKLLISESTPRF